MKQFLIAVQAVLLIVIIGVSISFVQYEKFMGEQHKQAAISSEQSIARHATSMIRQEIASAELFLEVIAVTPEIIRGDQAECSQQLRFLFQNIDLIFTNYGRVGTDGIFNCALDPNTLGYDVNDSDYMRTILYDETHPTVFGRVIRFNYETGTKNVIALHVPVYDGDTFVGTFGGAIDMSDLGSIVNESLPHNYNSYIVIIDDNGDILYHPNPDVSGLNMQDDEIRELVDPDSDFYLLLEELVAGNTGHKQYSVFGEERIAIYETIQLDDERHMGIVYSQPVTNLDDHIENLIPLNADTTKSITIALVIATTLSILGFVVSCYQFLRLNSNMQASITSRE